MKSILLSIRPEWVAKILNGEKTIEIRKKFPKDYVGWVYIYCTNKKPLITNGYTGISGVLNGKVVARFWCDKVERFCTRFITGKECGGFVNGEWCVGFETTDSNITANDIIYKSCIGENPQDCWNILDNYSNKGRNLYAIHISRLEVFDKSRELSEFYKLGAWKEYEEQFDSSFLKRNEHEIMKSLNQVITKAPITYCYIESEI